MTATLTTMIVQDADGNDFPIMVVDTAGTGIGPFSPLHILATSDGTPVSAANPFPLAGNVRRPAVTCTRPADTTAYAVGDLVANSTTAGSVTPMSFALGGAVRMIRSAKVRCSAAGAASATFRLHLYSASPTPANGDNGAWSTSGSATYLGSIDVTCDKTFTDGVAGIGYPIEPEIVVALASGSTIYGLLETRSVWTPTSGATVEVTLGLFDA